jgi:hypothetical protein
VLPSQLVAGTSGMAGSFRAGEGEVDFSPRHPFLAGTEYAVVVRDRGTWTIRRPAPGTGQARVTEIYPTAAELPFNCLKLYVYFSEPMSDGWASRALSLRTSEGSLIEGALLQMSPELWDSERRRLTVLFEPGRLKRGLAPNLEAGTPLARGQQIAVSVDARFKDASGCDLAAGAQRRYRIGPALRRKVDPGKWSWQSPAQGSRQPLKVRFERPLDRALLEHCLRVLGPFGRVAGSAAVGGAERSWSFTPAEAWRPGSYSLAVDPKLEDLAGNSLARVFDRDLDRPEDDPVVGREFILPIAIRR